MHVKPQLIIAALVLTAAVAGGLYVDAVRAKQHSALSGFFENEPVDVASRVDGRVSRLLVHEGDSVRRGQEMVELETEPRRLQAEAKAAAADQARRHWLDLLHGPRPDDIRKQQAAVDEARAALDRLRDGPLPEEIGEAKAAAQASWYRYRQAKRGPTSEEVAQAKARLDSAVAAEKLAATDAARYGRLFAQEAVTGQQNDQKQAGLREASANRRDMEEAYRRAVLGTPREELNAAWESYRQSREALALVERGARSEDIRAAEARLSQAESALALLESGNRPDEIAEAKAAYDAAAADARSTETDVAESTVVAPVDGVVESVPVTGGDLVNAGVPLVRLDDPSDIWLRVYVPESHLADVRVGDSADLRVDGVAGLVPARVESVASTGQFTPANLQTPGERGKQVFAVRLRLARPDERVKAGMYSTVVRIGNWRP